MNRETLDISNRGELQPDFAERELKVISRVDELGIGLDLRKHPELSRRLVEIGPHFDDSLDIARIIRNIYGALRVKLNLDDETPERLMRAAVLHDIGKSGPAGAEGEINRVVQDLFAVKDGSFSPYDDRGRPRTIAEYAALPHSAVPAGDLDVLKAHGVDPEREPMIEFWRRHAEWSYDILTAETGDDLDADLAAIAASHHLAEHHDPAHFQPEAVTVASLPLEKTIILAVIDKYQTGRVRTRLSHQESIAWIENLLAKRPELPPVLVQGFRDVLEVIKGSPDCLSQE